MHRRGTAIARQKGSVNIDTSIFGNIENPLRKNLSKGNNHNKVRLQRLKNRHEIISFDLNRLIDRNPLLLREFLHRSCSKLLSPT